MKWGVYGYPLQTTRQIPVAPISKLILDMAYIVPGGIWLGIDVEHTLQPHYHIITEFILH